MRKHGCQLPSHPLQVVAVTVFLALGVAFYVFFAPFVGKRLYQYVVMGIYTPLIIGAISLYIWCAAADPADPGVFKSKKYLQIPDSIKHLQLKESKIDMDEGMDTTTEDNASVIEANNVPSRNSSCFIALVGLFPCASFCSNSHEEFSEQKMSEDCMYYCRLCEVEVFKYSKHCRVCDKCVHQFDHHCRWLNNCVGRKNYRQFFTLMISSLLLLILQWATGIFVLIRCFIERKSFSLVISSNLGSSFTEAPFVIVVAVCTILAMIATLPLIQLFFFHILLIKKGISTYDYIMALKEQEQQGNGSQQSPQMSPASSLTGLSSTSSFNNFHRGAALCTPPRLFFEDQFDVVPQDTGSVSSLGKKTAVIEEPVKKKKPAPVKISPWVLARLNADQVSKAAAEGRKKSKTIQPASSRHPPLPIQEPRPKVSSSPASGLNSPDQANSVGTQQGIGSSSRSTSDGYEASGGEDSDRGFPSRFVGRSTSWSNHLFSPDIQEERIDRSPASYSFSASCNRNA